MRIGILSAGDIPYLGHALGALIQHGIAIDCMLLDSTPGTAKDLAIFHDRVNGRLPQRPLAEFENIKIPAIAVSNHLSSDCIEVVKARGIDLLVNIGTRQILTTVILEAPQRGIVSCHPGLLPEFRGCTCVEWAVFLDEAVGNTVYFMQAAIDHGPIVLREALTFSKADDHIDVRVVVYRASFDLLARGVRRIIDEDLRPNDLPPPTKGRYFEPIPDEKLETVRAKLRNGSYAYQR